MIQNHIYLKACGDLSELADESVHCVVTSAPFNISYRRQKSKSFNLNGYGNFCDAIPEDQYQDQQVAILEALGRVLTVDGSVFYDHKDRRKNGRTISPHEWIGRVKALSLYQTIVWDRGSSHNVDPIRQPPTTEYIYWLCKPGHKPRFNKACRQWGLVWRLCPHAETGRIDHPCPFPLAIPLRCIMMSGATGNDVVLDPYAGSGTSLVAATILGLPYIGYEINSDYITLAKQRIAEARVQWGQEEVQNLKVQECKPRSEI